VSVNPAARPPPGPAAEQHFAAEQQSAWTRQAAQLPLDFLPGLGHARWVVAGGPVRPLPLAGLRGAH
jgi:hypothetical protein